MVASPNLLFEETAQVIERLQMRLSRQRALQATLPEGSREISKAADNIAQMEKGLRRLQLYSTTLKSDASHTDGSLRRERDQFGKQYNRKWRPSRRQISEDE